MVDIYQDPFAHAKNLMYLWPMDLPKEVPKRVAISDANYRLGGPREGEPDESTTLESDIGEGSRDLASFPSLYTTGLTVILRKWDFYSQMYDLALKYPLAGHLDRVAWRDELLDSWGRHILYIERVLEAAIQWSLGDRGSICHVLRLFLAQEALSTVHTFKITRDYNIAQDDEKALRACEFLFCPQCPLLTPLRTALHDWQMVDRENGERIWLEGLPTSAIKPHVEFCLLKADRPPTMQVSVPLAGHMSTIVLHSD